MTPKAALSPAVVLVGVALLTVGCTPVTENPSLPARPMTCPASLDALRDPAVAEQAGSDYVAGTAVVHRFVDSPDPHYRGYDISITSAIAGLAEGDQVMFVVMPNRLPDITLGTEVMVVGIRGPGRAGIRPVDSCAPLLPLTP